MPKIFDSADSLIDAVRNSGVEINIPIDVEKIAGFLNIEIRNEFSLSPDVVGQICFSEDMSSDRKALIKLNPFQNMFPPRRRFTIAHEIAHFCLHQNGDKSFIDDQKSMSRSQMEWNPIEREANSFAAELLMPKSSIYDIGTQVIAQYLAEKSEQAIPWETFIERMSDKFQVSSVAMRYRLENLGIGASGG